MKKLKGHKPGCRCVGCSSATRKRGMAKLGLKNRRGHRNPLNRSESRHVARTAAQAIRTSEYNAKKKSGKQARYFQGKAVALAETLSMSETRAGRKAGRKLEGRARSLKNPRQETHFIGSRVTLYVSGRVYPYESSTIFGGPDTYSATVHVQTKHWPPLNGRVTRIDYDNPEKAMRAYGKNGRFRHDFTSPARIYSVGAGRITVNSQSRIWR